MARAAFSLEARVVYSPWPGTLTPFAFWRYFATIIL